MRALRYAAAGFLLLCTSQNPAQANYILTPKQSLTGASSATVTPGGNVAIDFILSSNAAPGVDRHISSIFQVNFTAPGLLETTYLYSPDYHTGDTGDDSTPNVAQKGSPGKNADDHHRRHVRHACQPRWRGY